MNSCHHKCCLFVFFAEDGRVKYKISFDEKGKSLVSGHHIAFDCLPKAEQLFVGARMVVKCPGDKPDKPKFCPCILAELPSRKNRMRFVFVMDHFFTNEIRLKKFPFFLQ